MNVEVDEKIEDVEALNGITYAKINLNYWNYKYFLEYEKVQEDSLLCCKNG